MTRRKPLERELYEPVTEFVRGRAFSWLQDEVPFYEYAIDIYAFSESLDKTIAVELKVEKWKRAFEQALLYQLCADWVYIAMPARAMSRVDSALLRSHGVGLISIEDNGWCTELISPSESPVLRSDYRSNLIASLLEARSAEKAALSPPDG